MSASVTRLAESAWVSPFPAGWPGRWAEISSFSALPERARASRWSCRRPERLALAHRDVIPLGCANIELPRAADLLLGIGNHLVPLGDPADGAREGEQRGEHLGREADRVQDNARIKVDVRIELLLDEIIVVQSDMFQFPSDVEDRVG